MEAGKQQAEGCGGEDRSECVAFLKDPGECAATILRQSFKGERGADAPFPTHGDSEQSAQDQEHVERGRKSAGEFNDGKADDIGHEYGPAAIAVGQHAEEQSANRTKGLSKEHRSENRRRLGAELAGDCRDAKDEEKEVEAIERPAKKRGQKNMALRRGEVAKRGDNRR